MLEPPDDTFTLEIEDSDRRDELCRWLGIARDLSARVAARLCARGAHPELAELYEGLAEAARSFGASSRRLRHAYDWDDRNRRDAV